LQDSENWPQRTQRGTAATEEKNGRKERKKKFGLSPAKAQRRKGEGVMPVIPSECEGSRKIPPYGRNDISSELGDFAPLREEYPNPSNSWSEKFAQAAQTVRYSSAKNAKKIGIFPAKAPGFGEN